jgi:REP element-mobilizing transposase RayT
LYFVTFCTENRQRILANNAVHAAFRNFALRGLAERNVAVGRYVIMPDHIHVFVRGGDDFKLSTWAHGLKRVISKILIESAAVDSRPTDKVVLCESLHAGQSGNKVWQDGFFDHMLRSSESYAEKWEYVRCNPVRAGLVSQPEDWPYQGEIAAIDRV